MQNDITCAGKRIGIMGCVIDCVVDGGVNIAVQGDDDRMQSFIIRYVGKAINVQPVAGIADEVTCEKNVLFEDLQEFDLPTSIGA